MSCVAERLTPNPERRGDRQLICRRHLLCSAPRPPPIRFLSPSLLLFGLHSLAHTVRLDRVVHLRWPTNCLSSAKLKWRSSFSRLIIASDQLAACLPALLVAGHSERHAPARPPTPCFFIACRLFVVILIARLIVVVVVVVAKRWRRRQQFSLDWLPPQIPVPPNQHRLLTSACVRLSRGSNLSRG